MKTVKRSLGVFLLVLALAALIPGRALAAGDIETDRDAALTINYVDGTVGIGNAKFSLYKVGDVDKYFRVSLTTAFEPYKNTVKGLNDLVSVDQSGWLTIAATLKGYVQRDGLAPVAGGKTDEKGTLALSVKPGLYLVIGYRATTADYNTYTAVPFMVFVPGEDAENNDWNYAVTVSPKFEKDYYPPEEPAPIITRKVLKVWDDAGYETIRPEEVIVQLLSDGTIYDTVTLNAGNNWRYAWDNLDAGHEWTLVEKELADYAVSVEQNGITYTVSNKYVVPIAAGDPPVQKKITGDKPETAGTFTFVMTAKDAAFPMPPGSTGPIKEMSVSGAGSVEFGDITFTKPGTYVYTISEKNTGAAGYTYDSTVFTVTYEVTQEDGELKVERTITDSKANTVAAVEFTNEYKTPGKDLPNTGIVWWPVPILILAGSAFILAGVIRRRRSNG